MKPQANDRKVNFEMQIPTWPVHILSNELQKRMKSTHFKIPLISVKLLSMGQILVLNFQSSFTTV